MKPTVMLCCVLLLSACSTKSQLVHKDVAFDKSNQAQIRLYGSYGSDLIRTYPAIDCAKWETTKGKVANRRFINGLPRKVRNISIGVPPTVSSRQAENDSGLVFRDSYREMVVPAKQPVVLDGTFSSDTRSRRQSCRVAATFTPKAGEAYEVRYRSLTKGCDIEIYRIGRNAENGIFPTEKIAAQYCAKPQTSF